MDIVNKLKNRWQRWRPDPARTTISRWLAVTNTIVILIVLAAISVAATGRLRDLANAQGLARVQLAGSIARDELRRKSEDVLNAARILAERPTVRRLLSENRHSALEPILRRYCGTAGLDACAVVKGTDVVASSGAPLPWDYLEGAWREQGERFFASAPDAPSPIQGATAVINAAAGARVLVARLLDDRMAKELSEHAGVQIHIIDYRGYADAPVGPFTVLHSAAMADGRFAAMRIKEPNVYAASMPLFASTGEAIALIEARMPTGATDKEVDQLIRNLLITAVVLAILAVLGGILLGRRVADPISKLREAAVKLGEGDFSTYIPIDGTAEVRQLGATMENMRRNLIDLTETLRRREAQAKALVSNIARELHAPLAELCATIAKLRAEAGALPPAKSAELLTLLEQQTQQLTRLIEELPRRSRAEPE